MIIFKPTSLDQNSST